MDTTDIKNRLQAFMKPYSLSESESCLFSDTLIYGDLWEYIEPYDVEWWSLPLTPHTHSLALVTKYRNTETSLPLLMEEDVVDIVNGPPGYICITCTAMESGSDDEYRYSYMMKVEILAFNIWPHIESLKNTDYEILAKNVEKHAEEKRFCDEDGDQLAPNILAPRLRSLLTALQHFRLKLDGNRKAMQPLRLTREISSQSGSQESLLFQTPETRASGTGKRKASASQSTRSKTPRQLKAFQTKKSLLAEEVDASSGLDASMESALTDIPCDIDRKEVDYKTSMQVFENYWAQCTDSYIFGIETKFKIRLDQLITPPAELNIRNLEQRKVETVMHYLIQMPDKSTKNTLCVFPKDAVTKPKTWEEIMDGKFYMVNGQHCVEASKQMKLNPDVEQNVIKYFEEWECFVVWNEDKALIRKISAYYNRVNHFMNHNPTWATNIIGARSVWTSLGSPVSPKEASEVGRAMPVKKTKAQKQSKDKYTEFMEAVKLRFALIDVKKTQKALSGPKPKESDLNIQNELKIITAPQDVYDLWSELISAHSQGELIDLDSGKKFRELAKWTKDAGTISREFFKWIGNTKMAQLKRLAEHLLNKPDPKRSESYPKVTMKKITGVHPNCYSAKDWLERCKRKTIVKRQIHNLRPDFGLISSSGEFKKDKWKKFKRDFRITPATLNVLLTAPGEAYYTAAKLTPNRNKPIEELSPYAAEFFKVFLANKGKFQVPKGTANFRPYDLDEDVLVDWNKDSWTPTSTQRIKMAIMDFRNLPGAIDLAGTSGAAPYFYNILRVLKEIDDPIVTDIPVWVWICGDKEAEAQILSHLKTCSFGEQYTFEYADYIPAQYERLEDEPHNSKHEHTPVQIIFLFKKGSKVRLPNLPKFFSAPNTPEFTLLGAYNELEYRIYNTELRMEFYLQVLDFFCKEGDAVLTVFGGGKLACAAWMNSLENFMIGPSSENEMFLQLAIHVLNLDRRDFEAGYKVDETQYPKKKAPDTEHPGQAKGKGKRSSKSFQPPPSTGASRQGCHIGRVWVIGRANRAWRAGAAGGQFCHIGRPSL